jgi:hypothetical protein
MWRPLLALIVCALPMAATAQEVVVLTSRAPYWKVGPRDDALSRACALGRFNLRRPEWLVARFVGKEGPGTLGVAKGTGVNLIDPGHKAKPREDYYFLNQATTSCEVFVGGRRGGR